MRYVDVILATNINMLLIVGVEVNGDTVKYVWTSWWSGLKEHGEKRQCGCSAVVMHYLNSRFGSKPSDQYQYVDIRLGMSTVFFENNNKLNM